MYSSRSAIHVRKKAKEHGTQRRIERAADVRDGSGVIVVDDVATSGGSALDVVSCLTDAGFKVYGVVVLVDRMEGAGEAFEAAGVPFVSLFAPANFK
jgi:orotate phosphoribosyltransferase